MAVSRSATSGEPVFVRALGLDVAMTMVPNYEHGELVAKVYRGRITLYQRAAKRWVETQMFLPLDGFPVPCNQSLKCYKKSPVALLEA